MNRRLALAVGTQKGAFVFRSDERRDRWAVDGPLFRGWKVTAFGRDGRGNYLAATASDVYGAGAVYVYVRSGNSWSTPVYIKASDTTQYDYFGSSLSLSADGNTLVVGAHGRSSYQGTAFVFVRESGSWRQTARLTATTAANSDSFGASVSINAAGTLLAVGAPGRAAGATLGAGAVYLYSRAGNAWTASATLVSTTPQLYAYYGNTEIGRAHV